MLIFQCFSVLSWREIIGLRNTEFLTAPTISKNEKIRKTFSKDGVIIHSCSENDYSEPLKQSAWFRVCHHPDTNIEFKWNERLVVSTEKVRGKPYVASCNILL